MTYQENVILALHQLLITRPSFNLEKKGGKSKHKNHQCVDKSVFHLVILQFLNYAVLKPLHLPFFRDHFT